MRIRNVVVVILLLVSTSGDYFFCNYEKLTNNEYKKIAELNQHVKRIDTMYNDDCLKGFFHVYLKGNSTDSETEKEIEQVMTKLSYADMKRDIWVFNKQKVFLYRLLYHSEGSKKRFQRTALQYPNQ